MNDIDLTVNGLEQHQQLIDEIIEALEDLGLLLMDDRQQPTDQADQPPEVTTTLGRL